MSARIILSLLYLLSVTLYIVVMIIVRSPDFHILIDVASVSSGFSCITNPNILWENDA
jgi:hypothetical protein